MPQLPRINRTEVIIYTTSSSHYKYYTYIITSELHKNSMSNHTFVSIFLFIKPPSESELSDADFVRRCRRFCHRHRRRCRCCLHRRRCYCCLRCPQRLPDIFRPNRPKMSGHFLGGPSLSSRIYCCGVIVQKYVKLFTTTYNI